MSRAALAVTALALACAPATPPPQPEVAPRPLPIPPDLAAAVAAAEERGHQVYLHDQAAWHATDLAMPRASEIEHDLIGWITVAEPGEPSLRVRFLEEPSPGEYASRIDVIAPATVVVNDPAIRLPEEEQDLARARALALSSRKRQCTETLNSVVLRDASGEIHVYLLAASKEPDDLVLAGHDLARISADGRTVLEWRALSSSCLVGKWKEGDRLHGLTELGATPRETHVFAALNYRLEHLFVVTSRGLWDVGGGRVSYYGKGSP